MEEASHAQPAAALPELEPAAKKADPEASHAAHQDQDAFEVAAAAELAARDLVHLPVAAVGQSMVAEALDLGIGGHPADGTVLRTQDLPTPDEEAAYEDLAAEDPAQEQLLSTDQVRT